MKLVYPYSGAFRVTSPFGPRLFGGETEYHRGMDFVGKDTKTVCSVCSGRVENVTHITDRADRTWEWGLYVKIRDCENRAWYYCHLSSALVSAGQSVDAGDHIGIEGSTGYSTGSHLHLELRENGVPSDPSGLLRIENKAYAVSPDYAGRVRMRFGLSGETLEYLSSYRWGQDLLRKLAESE